jgi:hypothetical protein
VQELLASYHLQIKILGVHIVRQGLLTKNMKIGTTPEHRAIKAKGFCLNAGEDLHLTGASFLRLLTTADQTAVIWPCRMSTFPSPHDCIVTALQVRCKCVASALQVTLMSFTKCPCDYPF